MLINLILKGKVPGFVREREQKLFIPGEEMTDLAKVLVEKYGVGTKSWQSDVLVNGKTVQDKNHKLKEGDKVSVALYPIFGGG